VKAKYYIGIDCGSVSIKYVVIDENNKLHHTLYLRNHGIIPTTKNLLKELTNTTYSKNIYGIGVTGSGRFLMQSLIGTNIVESEILSHSIATIHEFNDVQTILDIGGEDSKIIKIKDGVACDFRMNHICSAGTGAFLDSIANRLNIKVEDIGDLAMEHKTEIEIPGKCGIFAQSAAVSKINSGANINDVLWGICKALARNFVLLGKGISLKPPIVFQGAVAQNKAIHLALEREIGTNILVHPYCQFTGAIGIAMLANECHSSEVPLDLNNVIIDKITHTRIEKCNNCPNQCEVVVFLSNSNILGTYGNKCNNVYK